MDRQQHRNRLHQLTDRLERDDHPSGADTRIDTLLHLRGHWKTPLLLTRFILHFHNAADQPPSPRTHPCLLARQDTALPGGL